MNGETSFPLPPSLVRARNRALIAGVAGLILFALGLLLDPPQALRSYLVGYVYWVGIALGCFPLLLIHHLTGGRWGYAVRRPLEAGALTLPFMAVMFLPIALGVGTLYAFWADPKLAEASYVVTLKKPYLNVTSFLSRAAIYFVFWSLLALWLNRLSSKQDRPDTVRHASWWLGTLSGPALLLHVFMVTFASVDWMMSLEPEWYSTIFGPLWMSGQVLTAFSFMLVIVLPRRDAFPRPDLTAPDPLNDLGNLMLAFTMLWAYANLSQFLIIWSGNLLEEIPWYLKRMQGGWQWLSVTLIIFTFALPFLVLLNRENKRRPDRLVRLATLVVAMNLLSTFWLIAPSSLPTKATPEVGFRLSWMDPVAVVGVGGIWIAAFLWLLGRRSMVPGNAPPPEEEHHEGGH